MYKPVCPACPFETVHAGAHPVALLVCVCVCCLDTGLHLCTCYVRYTSSHMGVLNHIDMHTHVYAHMYTHTHAHAHTHTRAHTSAHTHTHARTHTHMHTHTQTCTCRLVRLASPLVPAKAVTPLLRRSPNPCSPLRSWCLPAQCVCSTWGVTWMRWVRTWTCIHTCSYTHTHTNKHTDRTHAHIHTSTHVHTYSHKHTHAHTHTSHTHVLT